MMIVIDRQRQQIVDLSSYAPIRDAIAVDVEARQVTICQRDFQGEHHSTEFYPAGVKLLRRP